MTRRLAAEFSLAAGLLGWLFLLGVIPPVLGVLGLKAGSLEPRELENFTALALFFLAFSVLPFAGLDRVPALGAAAVLGLGLAGVWHSASRAAGIPFYLKTGAWMAAFLLGAALGSKRLVREFFPPFFLVGGLALCALGFAFLIAADRGSGYGFLTSAFYQSDVFAGYLLLLIPPAGSLAVFSADAERKLLYGSAVLLFVVSLFLTYSRGAVGVFVLLSVFWGILAACRRPRAAKAAAAGVLLSLILGALYVLRVKNPAVQSDFLSKMAKPVSWFTASRARLSFWKGGMEIFRHHPWIGAGPGTFGRLFPMFQEKFYWYSEYPHNFYIQVLAEGGILTFAVFAALLFFALVSGWKKLRREGEDFPLALGLFFAFLAGALHLFLDVDSNFLLWSVSFWFLGGMLTAREDVQCHSERREESAFKAELSAASRPRDVMMVSMDNCISNIPLGRLPVGHPSSLILESPADFLRGKNRREVASIRRFSSRSSGIRRVASFIEIAYAVVHNEAGAFFRKAAAAAVFFVLLVFQGFYTAAFFADKSAQVLAGEGKITQALRRESLAIRLFPWDSGALARKAEQEFFLCAQPGRRNWCMAAKGDFRRALAADPVKPLYLGELARLDSYLGDKTEAESLLEKALVLDPMNYPLHYVELADLKREEGDVSAAQKLYEQVLRNFPPQEFGRLPSFRRDRFEAASAAARRALSKLNGAHSHSRKHALNRIRGPQVDPVLFRKLIERDEVVKVAQQGFRRLGLPQEPQALGIRLAAGKG